ncbi:restriction endonuclease subunit S [Neptunomonas phycophila]|uniref:restriction endonuclease subunit S n=1 Tax=Neptunomonas phycophila TaxID=1572645 RepID=UPI001BECF06C|nr:restriction endonuclease subunit S [Neptunomonas phycophila]MBT3145100.1 restriction endonuclease subunit S [Neptunomonas phycophila]
MEQVLYSLPDGWEWQTLSETTLNAKADIVDGPFGSNLKASEYVNEGVPILRLQNVDRLSFINKNIQFITKEKAEQLSRHSYKVGDIVITKLGAPLGKACIVPDDFEDGRIVADIVRARINEDAFDKRYICYAINSSVCVKQLESQTKGATRPRVNLSHMRGLILPVAPIAEQKRIVEKLDALLTRIDTAIEHLQESVTLVDALLKSSLSSMLTKQEHWDKVRLNDVCQITSKLCDPREEEYLDMFHIGGANITSFSGELIGLKTAREEKLISGKFPFDNSMVLYSKIRPYLMKVARPSISGICSADIYPLTPDNQKMNRDFLFYLLLSDLFTQYAIEGSSRAGMPKVNRKHLFNFEFFLPSIDEQKSICESLDNLVEKTNEVSKELTGKLSYLAGLKASILESAFKGQL